MLTRRWWPWVGAMLGVGALVWVLRGFDLQRFGRLLANADQRYLLLVGVAVMGEQLVRAWKWRQLLSPLRDVGTVFLFGTVIAGYLLAALVPFGFGTVARSWLVARRHDLKLASVLATVAMDRLTDGLVFACLVPVALLSVVFADPTGGIRTGLVWAGAGSFLFFALVLLALLAYRAGVLSPGGRVAGLVTRLPQRLAAPVLSVAASFAQGIAWPRERWRGIGVVLASLVIKLVAATHLAWAGLAFGTVLHPAQYLFLLVFLGFLVILGHFARVAGSFIVGGVFSLGLLGVEPERALAMVLVVEAMNLLAVASIGAAGLWWQGVALGTVRQAVAAEGGKT